MENVATVINHVMHDMTYYASNKESISCTCYETISKRDYVRLLNQLDAWRVFAPKAIVKKYGVKTVQLAVEYTKATKNVRVPGAYFTYMVRQLKPQKTEQPQSDLRAVKQEIDTNIPNEQKTCYKGTQLPQIENWQDARKFLCDYYEGEYEDTDNVISFVAEIKKKYNFG